MAYAEILRLTLAHAYFGSDEAPLTARAMDPKGFERSGLLLRQRAGTVHVLADDDALRPDNVQLTIAARMQRALEVTRGFVWGAPVALTAPLEVAQIGLAEGTATPSATRLGADMATLTIALPGTDRRDLTLTFDAIKAHWAYHLIGTRDLDGIEVIDSEGAVQFEDLGRQDLPDGQAARVLRSAEALTSSARPRQRFALQKSGPFGPETLVPVLPAAAPPFKPIEATGESPRLQSDIFVTLW